MIKKNILAICIFVTLFAGGVILTLFLTNQPNDESIISAPSDDDELIREPVFDFRTDREKIIDSFGQRIVPSFENFNFDSYGWLVQEFPLDKILGPIENEEMAKARAEEAWIEVFGERILDMGPFDVLYDELSNVWFLAGTLPPPPPGYVFAGSVPHIFIRGEDGQVLAVWMG